MARFQTAINAQVEGYDDDDDDGGGGGDAKIVLSFFCDIRVGV